MRTAAMDDYFFNEIKSHPSWCDNFMKEILVLHKNS